MDEPAFVIHGVGNRDRVGFTATVTALEVATGLTLRPVYWGDLGADDTFVDLALPLRGGVQAGLRDHDVLEDPGTAAVLAGLIHGPQPAGWGSDLPAAVREGVHDALDSDADNGLRASTADPELEQLVLDTLADLWPATDWLLRTDDAALLRETGRTITDSLASETDDPYAGLRGPGQDRDEQRGIIRRRLADLDRIAGAAMQAVAGRANHALRTRLGPATTRFLGDVLVYQRHREAIQARVRDQIAAVDPLLGTGPDHRVRLAAHSLGGVIAVDMAIAQEPLWISSLVTFGSQSAYFHLCDPRGGRLTPYSPNTPVALPPSLGRWTNLWQPLDVLAFAASRVFRHADGTPPIDIALPHTASAGLWTHSAYWDMPHVATTITDALRPDAAA